MRLGNGAIAIAESYLYQSNYLKQRGASQQWKPNMAHLRLKAGEEINHLLILHAKNLVLELPNTF